jgi:predicted transcriptional regulator
MVKLNKTDEQVIAALKEGGDLTLQEISEKTGETSKKVFKSLRKLFEHELIETKARKYKLSTKTPRSSKDDEPELPE